MCPPDTNYCQGQFDTSNLNTYLYSGNSAIANVCARAPSGRQFADDEWHDYRIEWHAGNSDDPDNADGCTPKVHFFFDDEYVTTVTCLFPLEAPDLCSVCGVEIKTGSEHRTGL